MMHDEKNPLAIKVINLEKEYLIGKNKFLGLESKLVANQKDLKTITSVKNLSFEIKNGDRVTCETVKSVCNKCASCKSGFYNLCKKKRTFSLS